jgi:hypothetical protein
MSTGGGVGDECSTFFRVDGVFLFTGLTRDGDGDGVGEGVAVF